MITTGKLKRQVWMADDDEFDHIVKNSQRVLKLNDQYENHPYVEEFTKERSVMFVYGTYILEGEADGKFSLGDIWNLLQSPNNASNFCRQIINCMRAWNYIQKTSGSSLIIEIIRQTHKIMMDQERHWDGKNVLLREYRKLPAFAGYCIFAPANLDDPIMAATILFRNITNIHPFEDGNRRICRLILAHVLMQMKCCLFPVILSSFDRSGRRHGRAERCLVENLRCSSP